MDHRDNTFLSGDPDPDQVHADHISERMAQGTRASWHDGGSGDTERDCLSHHAMPGPPAAPFNQPPGAQQPAPAAISPPASRCPPTEQAVPAFGRRCASMPAYAIEKSAHWHSVHISVEIRILIGAGRPSLETQVRKQSESSLHRNSILSTHRISVGIPSHFTAAFHLTVFTLAGAAARRGRCGASTRQDLGNGGAGSGGGGGDGSRTRAFLTEVQAVAIYARRNATGGSRSSRMLAWQYGVRLRPPRTAAPMIACGFVVFYLVTVGLVGWLVGWVGGWLVAWLLGCLVAWLVGWLGGWACGWLVGRLVSWLVGWLVGWLVDWSDFVAELRLTVRG
jgi:hypothetical protein